MAEEYDISRAFERIEEELIASMIRNMDRHRAEESAYGYEWSQWQAEQLRSLEHYRAENQRTFGRQFSSLNQRIENAIRAAHETGGMEQEEEILDAIRRGFTGYSHLPDAMIQGNFFRVNQRKLDALIQATTNDMRTAETAILRMANDQYRRVVFDAQVYAASGAGTYEKAVDMATHDMLAAGLNCVQYKNGARHTLSDYADMAIRTACKRAKLQGEGQKRQEWGVSTVIMNKRGNPCPKCLPWVGKVLIDDVWSGGSRKDGPYPLMSTAIAAGLYHPRCKDGHTTYFEGISTPPDSKFTRKELKQIEKDNRKEAQKQYAERQKDKFGRLADYSLDPENKRRYTARKNTWEQEKAVEKRGGNAIMTYKGIPKTWKRLEGTADDLDLKKVNPNYRWSSNDEYSRNCYNCVVAYEMRMRKYNVTAQPERKNKYLSWHPEAAWVEPDVKKIHTGEDPYQKIKDAFEEWPDGARAEIAVTWKTQDFGHVFVAQEEHGQIRFLNPQSGGEYTTDVFRQVKDGQTSFWRIDDRDVSDRGVTACKEE
jgi:hypothetical protein